MKNSTLLLFARSSLLTALAFASSLTLIACSSDDDPDPDATGGSTSTGGSSSTGGKNAGGEGGDGGAPSDSSLVCDDSCSMGVAAEGCERPDATWVCAKDHTPGALSQCEKLDSEFLVKYCCPAELNICEY